MFITAIVLALSLSSAEYDTQAMQDNAPMSFVRWKEYMVEEYGRGYNYRALYNAIDRGEYPDPLLTGEELPTKFRRR